MKKIFFRILLPLFIIFNLVTFSHAWKFTHFTEATGERTRQPEDLGLLEKAQVVFTGVSIPKPVNTVPEIPFRTVSIPSRGQSLEAWQLAESQPRGIALLFHGYAGRKSDLVSEGQAFLEMGFQPVLIDLLGHGGSDGNSTSIGYFEAEDIIASVEFFRGKYPEQPLVVFGFSMGAVSVLKALTDETTASQVDAAIIGAPFASMLQTVRNRFAIMKVPSFPFAEALVFWGGIQHGFPAFRHNPVRYAEQINTPVLIMHGSEDQRALPAAAKAIHQALKGPKDLIIYEGIGHASFCNFNPAQWKADIESFLGGQNL